MACVVVTHLRSHWSGSLAFNGGAMGCDGSYTYKTMIIYEGPWVYSRNRAFNQIYGTLTQPQCF